ncbi:MAG: hypothetical protein AVDCRST_MAG79-1291, partial [uncultured Thermoleophilia bacterium]
WPCSSSSSWRFSPCRGPPRPCSPCGRSWSRPTPSSVAGPCRPPPRASGSRSRRGRPWPRRSPPGWSA